MALSDIRTKLKAVLDGVTSIGVVTDFEPWANRKERFDVYFKSAALAYMQGWTITRESSIEEKRHQERVNSRRHLMVIRGYRALDTEGATEKTFQDLIETICGALRAKELDQLDGTALLVGPPQVRIAEARMFSDYLVHYVEITMAVTEEVSF